MAETGRDVLDEELDETFKRNRRRKLLRFDAGALLNLLQFLDGAVIEKDGRRIRIADESYAGLVRDAQCQGVESGFSYQPLRRVDEIVLVLQRDDWPVVEDAVEPPSEPLIFHSERLEDTLESDDGPGD